jgi:hypothetical protein
MDDPIIEAVRSKLLARSRAGILKYGQTLERTDLTELEWLNHLQEELLDAAGYIEVLIRAKLVVREKSDPYETAHEVVTVSDSGGPLNRGTM